MNFSDYFGINKDDKDTWFDPFLSLDTRLFIDPFLVYENEIDHFAGCHQEVVEFFRSVFLKIAQAGGNKNSHHFMRAKNALLFPEVDELCLGYTAAGTKGLGSGTGVSSWVADAIFDAVTNGIDNLTHFEEIGLLNEGIGADRISDIIGNLLRGHFAKYTKSICEKHKIPLENFKYKNGRFDQNRFVWHSTTYSLPRNPFNDRPILLVPSIYLRELPTINPDDFWSYCVDNENEVLRKEFNDDISSRVGKKDIVEFAKKHRQIREDYIAHTERIGSRSYDIDSDKYGFIGWYDSTNKYTSENNISIKISDKTPIQEIINPMLDEFQHFVEHKDGWRLLWNEDGSSKLELASQLLLLGILSNYCRVYDIDITREAEVGRGPVDFKFSQGFNRRVLLEVKKANNTKFWNGLERQLPTYLESEQISKGYFLVIILYDKDLQRISGIKERVKELNVNSKYSIDYIKVDARPKKSASKL